MEFANTTPLMGTLVAVRVKDRAEAASRSASWQKVVEKHSRFRKDEDMSSNKAEAPTAHNVSGIGNFLNNETKMEVDSGGTKARATSGGTDHAATVKATEKAAEKVGALKKAE